MNSSHPRMTIRSLGPIGVVTGPGGPVGIGIGLPIMSTMPHSQMVPQLGQYHPQKKLVSPDSSDGNDKIVAQLFAHHRSPPTVSSLQNSAGVTHSPMTWSNPLLPSSMSYPVMGMGVGVMGPTHGLSDASVLYGLISPAAAAQNMNIPNSTVNHQNQVLGLSSMTSNIISSEQVGSSEASFGGRDRIISPPQTAEQQPAKEIIHCKHVTLFPPNPSTPAPTTREKPPGCRTVFVGGLPEYVTEELVRELFDRCGEIAKIRMSKKNFCHIRFELEQSIEAAIELSGYRIRIGSNSDSPNIGRLHVDYAQARDDLYEFECRQRQHLREQRHKERIVKERLMPASPPNIAVYSDHEASLVAEKIKSDDSFIKGIHVLAAWLERGDCLKKNSTSFYSMIQSSNSHVRRLLNEKSQYEDELQKAKELMRQRMTGLLLQFSQIEKVFMSACNRKAWDHFSKPQRKNIEMWHKQATEIKSALLEEALAERNEEEMDLSETDSESEIDKHNELELDRSRSSAKKPRWEDSKAVNHLQEENDSLRCQLVASYNEVDMVKADLKSEIEVKDGELRVLQHKLNEQQNLLTLHLESHQPTNIGRVTTCNFQDSQDSPGQENPGQCDSSSCTSVINNLLMNQSQQNNQSSSITEEDHHSQGANATVVLSETDARLIGVISTFLHVHPFGASLDYIWSYTQKIVPTIPANHIEMLISKFPTLFRQETHGVGATLERKWVFIGFNM